MGKYLITGSPGVGKSTVARALKRRGFKAYDSESMRSVTRLEDKLTGRPADWPEPPIDWDRYAFNWQEKGLRKILSSDADVFVAASVSNMADYYDLFDRIFVLTADNDTLRRRLLKRRKSYGKDPQELAGILTYNSERQARFLATPRATAIDATQPLQKILDEIVSETLPESTQ